MKAKILIIEDDENISKNLVILFSSLEYEVNTVITAEAALEELVKDLPDLVICDINLPKMNGYMLKEKLNERKETFEIPFIYLTARNTYDDIRKGMKLAADDFIFKPFKAEEIIKSVEIRLLKWQTKNKIEKDDFIFLRVNNNIKKIFYKEIDIILGENQYSRVYQKDGKEYLIRKALNKWENILPDNFKRVNRSAIVNIYKIVGIENKSCGKYLCIENKAKKIKITNKEILGKLLNTDKNMKS